MRAIDMHCHFWPSGLLEAAKAGTDYFGWEVEGTGDGVCVISGPYGLVAQANLPEADLARPKNRIEARMSSQDIGLEAVMNSGFIWNYHLPRTEAAAFSRVVNDELSDLEERSPDTHRGLAVLPLPHTDLAIEEVRRSVEDLGLRHFGLGSHFDGHNFDSPKVLPVIEAIAEAGATMSVHPVYFGALGAPLRLNSSLLRGGLASPLEAGVAMTSIITSGVLDRFPDFRVWISHGGGAGMYSMGRLDRRWIAAPEGNRPTPTTPSEYLRRFWYGNLVHGDRALRFLLDMVGSDRITIGTDYPYQWDHIQGSANWIRTSHLAEADKNNILWKSAATFLGITPTWTKGPVE